MTSSVPDEEPDGKHKPIGGVIITDHNEHSPPQNIYEFAPLTPGQRAMLLARIRAEIAIRRAKRDQTNFVKAVSWAFKVFSYDANLASDFIPQPTYGVTFADFNLFIHRKEADAEAEEVMEDNEGAQQQ